MNRLLCLTMATCVLCLQACAAQDEATIMRATVSPASQEAEYELKQHSTATPIFVADESTVITPNAGAQASEYKPYVIYKDEGVDKNAIKESKSLDFGDDPQAIILADLTGTEDNIQQTHVSNLQSANHVANSQISEQNITTRQNATRQTNRRHSSIKNAHSKKHELKNNFVSAKYGNMEKCAEVVIQHMLRSPIFEKHNSSALVLGKVTNQTGDDSLPIGQIERVLKNTVSTADFIHVIPTDLERSTSKFDYTTNILVQYADESSNTNTFAQGRVARHNDKQRQYTIRIQLLNYYGELVGQWSAQTS